MPINPLTSVVAGLVAPITAVITKGQERRAAADAATAKLTQAKLTGEQQLQFTQAELEVLSKKNENTTWKDEVAMLTGLLPMYFIFIGSILAAFGHPEFSKGTEDGLLQMEKMGVPVGDIILLSIGAGLGFRALRR